MSIRATLLKLVVQKALHKVDLDFPDPDEVAHRRLYMTEEAFAQCPPNYANRRTSMLRGRALANARSSIKSYLTGEPMWENSDFKLLKPEDKQIWELRVTEAPQARLFGWFVEKDTFVVTHCKLRDELPFHGQSREWDDEIDKTIKKREKLVGLPIFIGRRFEDYVGATESYEK